jgi:hypothetical protein
MIIVQIVTRNLLRHADEWSVLMAFAITFALALILVVTQILPKKPKRTKP